MAATTKIPGGAAVLATVKKKAEGFAAKTGTDLVKLTGAFGEKGEKHLRRLTNNISGALYGDERALAHFKAQLAQADFIASATTYLAFVEWRDALVETVEEIVEEITVGALKVGGKALLKLLEGSFANVAKKD